MPIVQEWRKLWTDRPPVATWCILTDGVNVAFAQLEKLKQFRFGGGRWGFHWEPVTRWARDEGMPISFVPTHWKPAFKTLPGNTVEDEPLSLDEMPSVPVVIVKTRKKRGPYKKKVKPAVEQSRV